MKNKFLYILLEIIDQNGDIRRLVNEGLDYKSIGDLTNEALKDNYLILKDKKLILTEKGLQKKENDSSNFKRVNKSEWILPSLKNQIKKISKNDIFLPEEDELFF